MEEDGGVEKLCEYADVHALEGRRICWCVAVGEQVEVGTVLARCTLPSISPGLEGASAPAVEIRSDHKGELVRQLVEDGGLVTESGPRRAESGAIGVAVVRSCAHSTVWNGVCTACGEPVVTGGEKREASKLGRDDAKYGEFELTNDQVGRLEREAEERLTKARKLSLVLDLDETLINTAREPYIVTAKELTEEVHKAAGEGMHSDIRPNEVHELPSHRNHFTKLRPGVEAFLAAASQLCELNIFTKGGREYAADIAKILDPKHLYFRDRIISAAECGGHMKDLRRQYPVPDRMVVILDDRIDVWETTNPENVIRVPAYKFWNDRSSIVPTVDEMHNYEYTDAIARLNALAGFDRTDRALDASLNVLRQVHAKFFAAEDARESGRTAATLSTANTPGSASLADAPTVKVLLPACRRAVLAGVHICFSRCFDLRYDVRSNDLWIMAEQYGATCHEDLVPQTTHVVAKKYGTCKVNAAQKQTGVKIVHLDWLKESIKSWRRQPEEQFKLQTILMRPKRALVNWAWFGKTRPLKPRRSTGRSARTRTAADGRIESDSEAQSSSEESSAESDAEERGELALSPTHEAPKDDADQNDDDDDDDDDDAKALEQDLLDFLDSDGSDDGEGDSMVGVVDATSSRVSTGLHTDDDIDDGDLLSPPPQTSSTRFSSSSSSDSDDEHADAEDTPKASTGKKRRRSGDVFG